MEACMIISNRANLQRPRNERERRWLLAEKVVCASPGCLRDVMAVRRNTCYPNIPGSEEMAGVELDAARVLNEATHALLSATRF